MDRSMEGWMTIPAGSFKLFFSLAREAHNGVPADRGIGHVPPDVVYDAQVSSCCVTSPTATTGFKICLTEIE